MPSPSPSYSPSESPNGAASALWESGAHNLRDREPASTHLLPSRQLWSGWSNNVARQSGGGRTGCSVPVTVQSYMHVFRHQCSKSSARAWLTVSTACRMGSTDTRTWIDGHRSSFLHAMAPAGCNLDIPTRDPTSHKPFPPASSVPAIQKLRPPKSSTDIECDHVATACSLLADATSNRQVKTGAQGDELRVFVSREEDT